VSKDKSSTAKSIKAALAKIYPLVLTWIFLRVCIPKMARDWSVDMSRLKLLTYSDVFDNNDVRCRMVSYNYLDGSEEEKTLESITPNLEEACKSGIEVRYESKFIENMNFDGQLTRTTPIRFKDCVFINKVDLNFRNLECRISFKNCVFLEDFILFGTFQESVSFESSTFINSYVNFQECGFYSFAFNVTTLINSKVCFQQTEFWSPEVHFNDMHLYNSVVDFANSNFEESADLLDMLCVKADDTSYIRFIMVDFDFDEFRLWHADIACLRFLECTFNCRRFEFDCTIKTLIMQKCTNRGMMSLGSIKGLSGFNMIDFVNSGTLSVGKSPQIFVDAVKSDDDIVWVKGHEYRAPSQTEKNEQIHDIGNIYMDEQRSNPERICFGTFASKIMPYMQAPDNKQGALARLLFKVITDMPNAINRLGTKIDVSDRMATNLFNFRTDVIDEIKDRASQPDMPELMQTHFKENVVPKVRVMMLGDLLSDVKNLVRNDNSTSMSNSLLKKAEPDTGAEFLADVFLYAIQRTNKKYEKTPIG